MFPTGFSGQFEIVAVEYRTIEILLQRVERELRFARALAVRRSGNKVSFKGGIFRMAGRSNVLNPVSSGEIEIVPGNPAIVRYRFSCVQLLTFVTIFASSCAIFLFSTGAILSGLIFPLIIWLSMFGLNFLGASATLPAFVRKAMQG
jgi:hypothetical protein